MMGISKPLLPAVAILAVGLACGCCLFARNPRTRGWPRGLSGFLLTSGRLDGLVAVDMSSGRSEVLIHDPEVLQPFDVAFDPRRSTLYCRDSKRNALVSWASGAAGPRLVYQFTLERGLYGLFLSPSGDRLFFLTSPGGAKKDREYRIFAYDVTSETLQLVLSGPPSEVPWLVGVVGEDRLLGSTRVTTDKGREMHTLLELDIKTKELRPALEGRRFPLSSFYLSPGGNTLCVAEWPAKEDQDKGFRLYDYPSGRLRRVVRAWRLPWDSGGQDVCMVSDRFLVCDRSETGYGPFSGFTRMILVDTRTCRTWEVRGFLLGYMCYVPTRLNWKPGWPPKPDPVPKTTSSSSARE